MTALTELKDALSGLSEEMQAYRGVAPIDTRFLTGQQANRGNKAE